MGAKKKSKVTDTAPKGESKMIEICGVAMLSGEGKQVICDEDTMARLERASKGGGMLKVVGIADYMPPEPKEK